MGVMSRICGMQNEGEAADGDQVTARAAADSHAKADRAQSRKREAARAAAKEVAVEQQRRKAELEMLMMPDAELRSGGELAAGSCFHTPHRSLTFEADPEATATTQVGNRLSMVGAAPPTSSTSCPGRTGSSRRRRARWPRPARTVMRTLRQIQVRPCCAACCVSSVASVQTLRLTMQCRMWLQALRSGTSHVNAADWAASRAGVLFQADLADPRFRGLFQAQDFAIDPTDPRFKQMGGDASALSAAIAKQRSQASTQRLGAARPAPAAEAAPGEIRTSLRQLRRPISMRYDSLADTLQAAADTREGPKLDATVAALKRKLAAGGRAGSKRREGQSNGGAGRAKQKCPKGSTG